MLPNAKQPASSPDPCRQAADEVPDLHTQLEALLHEVWGREAEWRLDDRLDLALRRHGC